MTAVLLALLAATFPSTSATAWMDPDAFHLRLGMSRSKVVAKLKSDGWTTVPGNEPHHLVVQYDEGKTITLIFRGKKLDSARFELIGFIPTVKKAFSEQERILAEKRGEPTRRFSKPMLLTWTDKSPHIDMVLATNRESSFGQQGLGFLVVRYFVPPPRAETPAAGAGAPSSQMNTP